MRRARGEFTFGRAQLDLTLNSGQDTSLSFGSMSKGGGSANLETLVLEFSGMGTIYEDEAVVKVKTLS